MKIEAKDEALIAEQTKEFEDIRAQCIDGEGLTKAADFNKLSKMKEEAESKKHGGGVKQPDEEITKFYNCMNKLTPGIEGLSKLDFDAMDKYWEAAFPAVMGA